jgi:hypothetical protein
MSRVEEIERQIVALSRGEFAQLRDWLIQEDAKVWDAQLEADVEAGKLDRLGAAARRARAEGKSTQL